MRARRGISCAGNMSTTCSHPDRRRTRRTRDMIDTGRRFCWIMFGYPLMRCDVLLSFKRHGCLCGKTKKSILTAGPDAFQKFVGGERQIVQPFSLLFFTMWHMFGILSRQTKQQTILILLALIRVYQGRPRHKHHVSNHSRQVCMPRPQVHETAPPYQILQRQTNTVAATLQNTSSCAKIHPPHFGGHEERHKQPSGCAILCTYLAYSIRFCRLLYHTLGRTLGHSPHDFVLLASSRSA
jgi:hypothetical protein